MKIVEQAAGRGSVTLYDYEPPPARLLDDVLHGLALPQKQLPPKYFYDERGARLFERICELPEYYPTATETAILRTRLPEIADALGARCRVVEFGSGSGAKTQHLLEHLHEPAAYVPVDISRAQLVHFAIETADRFPGLEVLPVCADYTGAFELPAGAREHARTVAFFPGSTIGNFEHAEAERFLARVARLCGADGALLIGVDLAKPREIVEPAYDDARGVTAEFNRNLLVRINRECGADFELAAFAHRAPYDAENGRIEMRLVSRAEQTVHVPRPGAPPAAFEFRRGEYVITEYSHKYDVDGFRALAARAGWRVERLWTDERRWFGVFLLTNGAPGG